VHDSFMLLAAAARCSWARRESRVIGGGELTNGGAVEAWTRRAASCAFAPEAPDIFSNGVA